MHPIDVFEILVSNLQMLNDETTTARKIGFTQIYWVKTWCKKVQTRREIKSKDGKYRISLPVYMGL